MIINIGNTKDECEFYLDLEKVADKLGCDASDFKQIDAQFGRLGQQWITTAGASSGAWLGLWNMYIGNRCSISEAGEKNKKQVS